ncbi:MAG: sigma-54-dependent Fis family transcriptional regulator [Deltaproteobacteria bacterium]|nr:sigma-54-dependent Fis family transcriptional regulator [Deltaproteobacteria bacterium]
MQTRTPPSKAQPATSEETNPRSSEAHGEVEKKSSEQKNDPSEASVHVAGRARVLIVDDERAILRALRKVLGSEQYEVITLDEPLGAVELLREQEVDVMLVDLRMPHMSGMELLQKAKELRPQIEVVIMTAFATVETALEAVKSGAFDYLTKPFESIGKVTLVVDKALERKRLVDRTRSLEKELKGTKGFASIIGTSEAIHTVFQLIESVAPTSANVLIQGETGTGKELVARAIHTRSERSHERMVPINCSAMSESLLESEIFGHKKGSFTGATHDKKGLFEVAHRGTIFLDELGDMALSTQVKLLRVLQEGEVRPIGASEIIKVDVRVVAATHVDLEKAMKDGRFREDLYYRLNVISIQVPALRDRKDDIPMLATFFLQRAAERYKREVESIEPECLDALLQHDWEGNVRELENVIDRAVVLCRGRTLEVGVLPPNLLQGLDGAAPVTLSPKLLPEPSYMTLPFKQAKEAAVGSFERRYVENLLARCEGNVSQAAREAGLDRSNFRRVLQKHDVMPDAFKSS